jgi:FeS assembly SUF system protein
MPERLEPTVGEPRPLNPIEKNLLKSEVIEGIRQVFDPEIPVNVYDLGLIYDIDITDDALVQITMTLTSPACPVAGTLPGEVQMAAAGVAGVRQAHVDLTWDPPFTIDMVSDDVKLMLGLM